MLRSDIRVQALEMLDDEQQARFTTAKINRWIDLWWIDIASRLAIDKTNATVTTVSGSANYNLGDHIFMDISEVFLVDPSGTKSRIKTVTMEELPFMFGIGWKSNNNSTPIVSYQVDYNVLGLHPVPDDNAGGRTLEVWGYADPTNLASDSTTPIVMRAIHDSGPHFVAYKGFTQFSQLQKAAWHYGMFEKILNEHRLRQIKFAEDEMAWRLYNTPY